jgi:DNA-binding NarL/FixJ family response regulator
MNGKLISSSKRSEPARIVIADDHPLFRDALRQMLDEAPDLEVVGEEANGQRTLELCRRLRPDLVLMDVRMPKMDGLEATHTIRREFPRTIVLILTSFDDPDLLLKALRAGAAGYVLKYVTRQQLVDAIRRVLRGETPLNQELAAELILRLNSEAKQETGSPLQSEKRQELPPELLTDRELEVLRLVAKGQRNSQIARNLAISCGTVKIHIHHIISKLDVSDRTEAVVRAIGLGIITS